MLSDTRLDDFICSVFSNQFMEKWTTNYKHSILAKSPLPSPVPRFRRQIKTYEAPGPTSLPIQTFQILRFRLFTHL